MNRINYYGTLGPACASFETLLEMFKVGMTGIRLNLSHVDLKDSGEWLDNYNKAATMAGMEPELLIDLEGPELRIGNLKNSIGFKSGEFAILGKKGIPVPSCIISTAEVGEKILLSDGLIEFYVKENQGDSLLCEVVHGGLLQSKKNIAIPRDNMNPTLTHRDYVNIKAAINYGVTGVMLPFVRGKEDLITLKEALLKENGQGIKIYAKLENILGVKKLTEIIDYCDEIVIARGDLGNSMPLWELPRIQKNISEICRSKGKHFMVVTQMLNSMIENPVPTRAEVLDIYNAVLDGAASVMLTGETAQGKYPIAAMEYLIKTAEEALKRIN
ncbi:pyruvate kinase [Alloiococcus sp. CFN-8]|uniref:pyruvate kinase n=1 Tax=Alloiococcus sp. CFN-8 TaxID=3416081 RepID=UPI003CFB196A